MAKATPVLIEAIRRTAKKLETGAPYQWGHMGSCNCGNLAQELTSLSQKEIHDFAMRKQGDWQEQVEDYCPTSGLAMDTLITRLLDAGLSIPDLENLERLSDKRILKRISPENRNLKHNLRDDVVLYLKHWADLLEEEISERITLVLEPAGQKEPVLINS